jgi:hypothetical protein
MGAGARKENNQRSRQLYNYTGRELGMSPVNQPSSNGKGLLGKLLDKVKPSQNTTGLTGSTDSPTVMSQIQGFANNPYSAQETQDLRSRALRPIESAYAGNLREMDRAARISGGAPNLIAARAKSLRDRSQGLSNAMTDVNAGLAADTANKRLAGLGLLSSHQQGLLGAQAGAPPIQGFNWSGLLNPIVGLGSAFLNRLGGKNSTRKIASPGYGG